MLQDVEEFAALARAGEYLGGDRRVSPKARTRWRFTFRDLTDQALQVLNGDDGQSVRVGIFALSVWIDVVRRSSPGRPLAAEAACDWMAWLMDWVRSGSLGAIAIGRAG